MRVAILAGSFASGSRIAAELKGLPACEVHIVLCPEHKRTPLRRLLKECWRVVKDGFPWTGIQFLLRGRVLALGAALDSEVSTKRLASYGFDVGLHNAGVIYRAQTFACFRMGILNPHIGLLPEYRGRSVMEWSVVLGDPTGITVFFMDAGIDTGERIVLRESIPVHGRTIAAAKQHLFAQDARLFRRALEMLQDPWCKFEMNDHGRRYYPLSNLLSGVVERLLQEPADTLARTTSQP